MRFNSLAIFQIFHKEYSHWVTQVNYLIILLCFVDKHMHILDNLNELREMMAGVGQIECERPGGLDIFEAAQARKISEYFHQS